MGLVLGCVQRVFDPAVNHATIAVLQANGVEVVLPASQGCCGAASHHQGELEQTRDLARDLVKQFEGEPWMLCWWQRLVAATPSSNTANFCLVKKAFSPGVGCA